MIVIVMRHGEAEPRRPGVADAERGLTEKGRRDVEAVARLLPVKPSRVASSPLRRAKETAEIVASAHGAPVEVAEELRPDRFGSEALLSLAERLGDRALLVGHAPSVDEAIQALTGCRVKLKPAAAAVLEVDPSTGEARLQALIPPPLGGSNA